MNNLAIKENIPLAPFTTLQIGGAARFFVDANCEVDVVNAIDFASQKGLEVFILGGGSNLLVSDAGFDGLVIHILINGINQVQVDDERVRVTVGAGEDWDKFVADCVEKRLAGIECLSGIPGSVGGTPVQNVGAYGQEVSETIRSVTCLDRQTGEVVTMPNSDCGFSYRKSIFNSSMIGRFIVLRVEFELISGGSPKLAYRELIEAFDGEMPSIAEVRDAVLRIRRGKSMVIDAEDPNSRSAGSFFKNPIISTSELHRISNSFTDAPSFSVDSDSVKVPAAWLIENAGFAKGYRIGNVGISTKHTLALVNFGGGSSAEIIELKNSIQMRVFDVFGIRLEPEPIFVGF